MIYILEKVRIKSNLKGKREGGGAWPLGPCLYIVRVILSPFLCMVVTQNNPLNGKK